MFDYLNCDGCDNLDCNSSGVYCMLSIRKDTYLDSLYTTLEMCEFVLSNSQILSPITIEKYRKLKAITEINIKKRKLIPYCRRI